MREILFRGKRTDNGELVEGFFLTSPEFHNEGIAVITTSNSTNRQSFYVHLNTVGEYTGLTDKNGKKIFEGDIVRILYTDWASKSENDARTLEEYLKDIAEIGTIVFGRYGWKVVIAGYESSLDYGKYGYIEVIGNIYDNPELLEVHNDNA